jgi:hypothetical protein
VAGALARTGRRRSSIPHRGSPIPVFLGPEFAARLKNWIAAQRTAGAGVARARADAEYLFRRMYGGCG